jgi:hypothetical protein
MSTWAEAGQLNSSGSVPDHIRNAVCADIPNATTTST